ncbi:MAG: MFS transporter [Oscillospiraceae bacterium]|jgi:fucose permease|nr:MFS transporter [Oscillospiraceae bacterium]
MMEYRKTVRACYLSYISHAVIINLPPLLFALLSRNYGLDTERLGRLVLVNFLTQLIVDGLAAKLADRIGYRVCLVSAHLLAALGLLCFGLAPLLLPAQGIYLGLCVSVVIFAAGGGLIEVLVSPIVNQVSGHLGAGAMTLLHSFYCWGQVLTVLLSTLVLHWLPERLWYWLPIVWMALPLMTMTGFARAPLAEPKQEDIPSTPLGELLRSGRFWRAIAVMAFAGAAESSMAQWASYFAEQSVGVSKLTGDLAGPCIFALLMAVIRMCYGKWEKTFPLETFLLGCGVGCVLCFLAAGLSRHPYLALAACALTGVMVSLMWPGTLHRSAQAFPRGGTGLFGMLALGGDFGCSAGPWLLGAVAHRRGDNIQTGLLTGALFPLGFTILLLIEKYRAKGKEAAL